MNGFLGNFRRLADVNGPEPRRRFWPYVALVYLLSLFVSQALMVPALGKMVANLATLTSDPDFQVAAGDVAQRQFQARLWQVLPTGWISAASIGTTLFLVGLLGAAVIRRLRDAGLSAWWCLLPVPGAVAGPLMMAYLFATFGSPVVEIMPFALLSLLSIANLVTTVLIVVLLAQPTRAPDQGRLPLLAGAGEVFADFARLFQFAGREPRRRFWPYAGLVFLVYLLSSTLAMQPVLSAVFDAAQAGMTGLYPAGLFSGFFYVMGGEMLVLALLLAAAVSRRLHDGGLSGFWGLLPVPFAIFGLVGFRSLFTGETIGLGLFAAMFLNNMAYLAALIGLVVLLCRRSKTVGNRFEPSPSPA